MEKYIRNLVALAVIAFFANTALPLLASKHSVDPSAVTIQAEADRIQVALDKVNKAEAKSTSTSRESTEAIKIDTQSQYEALKAKDDRLTQQITDHCDILDSEGWNAQNRLKNETLFHEMRQVRQAILNLGVYSHQDSKVVLSQQSNSAQMANDYNLTNPLIPRTWHFYAT